MKVVLFCGGMGMRLREYSHTVPKPMVPLRWRPILWHVMKYYAHYGHKEFILCLGYQGDVIKEYFLKYNECLSNDFVLSQGGRRVELLGEDISDWRITFVDTGINANIGQRLKAVEPYLEGDEVFLANYSDGLTACPLPDIIRRFEERRSVATFLTVRPNQSFHLVTRRDDDVVTGMHDVEAADIWINGGYFVLRRDIFTLIGPGEELVVEPFARLMARGAVSAHPWRGFWRGVDTFKDLQELQNVVAAGPAPWEVWLRDPVPSHAAAPASLI